MTKMYSKSVCGNLSMNREEYTSMGGRYEAFQTTEWSVIGQIGSADSSHAYSLINNLLKDYWKPVYCYLRRKGYHDDQAKDLTQGFFHEVVLGRSLVKHADQSRGRFRTFLLTALQQYVAGTYRKQATAKRRPKGGVSTISELSTGRMPAAPPSYSPENSFHYAWAAQLLDRLFQDVEAKCRADGMTLHWEIFQARVVQPIMQNTDPPSLAELCRQHGISDCKRASNMIVTVNRRFRSALKRHIRRSVASDCDVESEYRELLGVFANKSAR